MYIWKILEKIVPNPSPVYITEQISGRRGRVILRISLPSSSTARVKTLRDGSFMVSGPKLFNCLPRKIRDITGVPIDKFKQALDNELKKVPDEPPVYPSVSSNKLWDFKGWHSV